MKRRLKLRKEFKLLLVIVCCFFMISWFLLKQTNEDVPDNKIVSDQIYASLVDTDLFQSEFDANYTLNDEYIGHLYFESNLVDELVCQSTDNVYYLNHDFNGNEDSQGTVFLDYLNTLDDQNLIFYGHYVYYDESKKFSPLSQLVDESEYDKNKKLTLQLKDERREYEVYRVFYYQLGNSNLEYFHPNYPEEYFEQYIKSIDEICFYKTDVELSYDDKFVTLQTCVRNQPDKRLIIIAKQVN